MGNLFGSEKQKPKSNYVTSPPRHNYSTSGINYPSRNSYEEYSRSSAIPNTRSLSTPYNQNSYLYYNDNVRYSNQSTNSYGIQPMKKVDLYKDVINISYDWDTMADWQEMKYVELDSDDQEFLRINRMFLSKTRRNFVHVISIQRIQNPYLMGRYMLKKLKTCRIMGKQPEEINVFHGTRSINVDGISLNNFDWRKHGSQKGHIFGQGVSFSPISHYASHYCDKSIGQKVLIVSKVLFSGMCVGDRNMIIPPYMANSNCRYDSSGKPDGKVIVKYDDDDFYPEYKIVFNISNIEAYYKVIKQ